MKLDGHQLEQKGFCHYRIPQKGYSRDSLECLEAVRPNHSYPALVVIPIQFLRKALDPLRNRVRVSS